MNGDSGIVSRQAYMECANFLCKGGIRAGDRDIRGDSVDGQRSNQRLATDTKLASP